MRDMWGTKSQVAGGPLSVVRCPLFRDPLLALSQDAGEP
jgi:hypothetical protein